MYIVGKCGCHARNSQQMMLRVRFVGTKQTTESHKTNYVNEEKINLLARTKAIDLF